MKIIVCGAALCAAIFVMQPAAAALITLDFTGTIGPITTPASLAGGAFDGTIRFDNAQPFASLPGTLIVRDGPLAGTYQFGAANGAFIPATYRTTFTDNVFAFQGNSDEGASLTFNLAGDRANGFSGYFAFARGSDFSAVGNATTAGASPVPEPASWTFLIAGFAAVGLVARRRTDPSLQLS